MRVLWLATAPSLFDESKVMGWIASLEAIVRKHCTNIELGITFEYDDERFKVQRDNVTYYPIKICKSFCDVVRMKFNGNDNWYLKREPLLKIIEDFKPDIIHCFGSEWNWGLISKETRVPIVVHMQGFYNIYNYENQVVSQKDSIFYN
ncbi:MAG: hypothetical protein HUJ63_13045, partial [Enterococcus sp.]|nr:hypothetical protein [Enterococcus sp.]